MACVGDATGIIKAQLADKVAGIINTLGSTPNTTLAFAKMGNTKLVVAVFDVNSVNIVNTKQTITINTIGESMVTWLNALPITVDSPELSKPPANAKPPPNKSKIPHGKVFT